MDFKHEFASFLHENGAIKFGEFTLSSGAKSPYYVDLRIIASFPHPLRRTIKHLHGSIEETVGRDGFDALASVPTGGLVLTASLAFEILKPLVYVRTKAKDHGTSRMIEGRVYSGMKVLLVDDVSTSGGSIVRAARLLRAESATVTDAFVVVDRKEGAAGNLAREGIRLHSLANVAELARILREDGTITDDILREVEARATD